MLQITIITLISSAREQLGIYGYSKYGIKTFTRVWERFRIYADINELTVYTEDLMMAFMEEDCHHFSAPGTVPSYQEKMRALNKLDEFYKYNMISSNRLHCRKNYLFYGCLEKTVKSYLTYRTECISEARLQSIKLYLERFCSYTEESGVSCVNELSVSHLSGFIEFCSIYTVSTVASTACCLRGYLSYLWSAGHTELNLSYSVPKIHCRKDSEIPSAYSKDEVNHLLECVDRTNPKGKRDYAMMLLDLNTIVPNAGKALGALGSIPENRQTKIMNTYIVSFFNKYLKEMKEPLLNASTSQYPEVTIEKK
jgi:integrase/recombinase XerD